MADRSNQRFRQPEHIKERQLEQTRQRFARYLDAPRRSQARRGSGIVLVILVVAGVFAWLWWKAKYGL